MIFYLCNRKKCGEKCSYPECKHTSDYAYALNRGITPKVYEYFYCLYDDYYEKPEREEIMSFKEFPFSKEDWERLYSEVVTNFKKEE